MNFKHQSISTSPINVVKGTTAAVDKFTKMTTFPPPVDIFINSLNCYLIYNILRKYKNIYHDYRLSSHKFINELKTNGEKMPKQQQKIYYNMIEELIKKMKEIYVAYQYYQTKLETYKNKVHFIKSQINKMNNSHIQFIYDFSKDMEFLFSINKEKEEKINFNNILAKPINNFINMNNAVDNDLNLQPTSVNNIPNNSIPQSMGINNVVYD
eukprot:jgi/Orpsp1_1/1175364/evm.model.c7180000053558.1